ncbi:MAG: hypothetical protein TRG1_1727 [Flavobacteriaceae bacterium FS1-H7996/R]|nr:MAG: hypothetical protein TRG1_1727 [Flavobacteriaceae bacterium FS1-H7996/R]
MFTPNREDELFESLKKAVSSDKTEMHQKVLEQFERKLSFRAIGEEIKSVFEILERRSN